MTLRPLWLHIHRIFHISRSHILSFGVLIACTCNGSECTDGVSCDRFLTWHCMLFDYTSMEWSISHGGVCSSLDVPITYTCNGSVHIWCVLWLTANVTVYQSHIHVIFHISWSIWLSSGILITCTCNDSGCTDGVFRLISGMALYPL